MAQRRASQLTIGYSPIGLRQSAWDVPLDGADMIKAFPATSRNYVDIDTTVEDVDDCTGENLLMELITAEVARLNIDFDVDPDVLAVIAAFGYGVAAAPTGGSNEVQTETISATGGTRSLTVQVGAEAQTTTQIPFDATHATIQAALEALSNVAPGDIVVSSGTGANEVQHEAVVGDGGSRKLTFMGQTTGNLAWNASAATIQAALEGLSNLAPGDVTVADLTGGMFTYTFGGAYADVNVEPISSDVTLLTNGPDPGTSTFTTTTGGSEGTRIYTFSGTAFSKRDVNLIAVNTYGLTGGTSVIVETTPGVGQTHAISRLVGYTLPLMTLYVGFRGSTQQPVIFKNVVVNNFRVRSASRQKVTCSVELIGSGDLETAIGYSMPDCQDIVPIRFGDCKISIGGVDFMAGNLAREFEYTFANDVNPKFDGSGIYATRHERADKRPSQITAFILGEPGDAIYNLAKARTLLDAFIQCGPDGRNIRFSAPGAILKLATAPIRFGGDPAESEMALISRPKKTIGDATTPTNVSAVIGTSATLLTAG